MRGRFVMRFDFDPDPPGLWTRRACVAAVLIICFLPVACSLAVIFWNGR